MNCHTLFLLPLLLTLVGFSLAYTPNAVVHGKCATSYKGACVCTEKSCDAVEPLGKLGKDDIVVYTTSFEGARLARSTQKFDKAPKYNTSEEIKVSYDDKYQTILGVGCAFTDAMAINLMKMDANVRELILENYFGPTGLQYSVGRIPIASCDFSETMYSYDDVPFDYSMSNFSIEMDITSGKIAMIQQAIKLRQTTLSSTSNSAGFPDNNGTIVFTAAPWSPPAWMKTTNNRVHGSLNGTAGDALHKSYALYLSKFLSAYKANGIEVAFLSVQNEPTMTNSVKWDSCLYTPETMRDFVKLDLGPQISADHPNTTLLILDDQRGKMKNWMEVIYSDPVASNYSSTVGCHWYGSVDELIDQFGDLATANKNFPQKHILATEACEGSFPWAPGVELGSWFRATNFFKDISGDFNNYAIGWISWPGVVDLEGGPNHAKNFVDAEIVANTTSGKEFYKNPMFYAMGHFSLFAPSGSIRLGIQVPTSPDSVSPVILEASAFLRPDGIVSVMISNKDEVHQRWISISHPTKGVANVLMPAGSIITVCYEL